MILDYHLHLRPNATDEPGVVDHSLEAVERYVNAAHAAGVDEIGFSEHVYYFTETRDLWQMPYHLEHCVCAVAPYIDAVLAAKQRGLPVKLGIEVDYEPHRESETRAWLARYPWDYVLGSVHFVDGFGIDGRPRLIDEIGLDDAWRRYFERLGQAAESGLFDSLAHPDLVKMWGDRPTPELEEELFAGFADRVSATAACIEVSTAGLGRPVEELYPDRRLLAACRARGVPVTTASDAHEASRVGWGFARSHELLRSVGYETVTIFETRMSRQVPLG